MGFTKTMLYSRLSPWAKDHNHITQEIITERTFLQFIFCYLSYAILSDRFWASHLEPGERASEHEWKAKAHDDARRLEKKAFCLVSLQLELSRAQIFWARTLKFEFHSCSDFPKYLFMSKKPERNYNQWLSQKIKIY